MTYYKIIGGVRYDRNLLEEALATTNQGRNEYRISYAEIKYLYRLTADGRAITEVERRTLHYIAQHYRLTGKAKKWLLEQLPAAGSDEVQTTIQRVLRQSYGLPGLRSEISTTVVQQYLDSGGARDWEAVLRGAMEAFLRGSQGQLSLGACVARQDGRYKAGAGAIPLLKSYLDRGTLYLIPPDATPDQFLPYDLPHVLNASYFWTFVLQIPDFEPVEFFAFVHREQPLQFNKGQFSKKADPERTITAAVRQFAQFSQLEWQIPGAGLERQLSILPHQNFGNALFAALHVGVFNQESSASFGDFIRQEIWPDPEIDLSETMRAYADSGVLHLIPLDYRAQADSGTAAFPVPEQYAFWMDGEWVFGLEMPGKTQLRLIITTPRDGNNGEMAWNDGFMDHSLPLEDRLQTIVMEEFDLDGLQTSISITDFETQRLQFGPDWRHLPGLLRQALHTVLHDYLSANGVFNGVANRHQAEVTPTQFEDPQAYRAAIRPFIKNYLRSGGTLELLPYLPGENAAPNGETIEQNWIFRTVLPDLADHYFWIVIPRWPDDEQRPYNYIG